MNRVFVRGNAETYANYDLALRESGMEPVFSMDRPIFGICRGHQILNVALGGDMIQHVPDHGQLEHGVDSIHMVNAEHDFLRGLYGDRFPVNSAHHQVIGTLGKGLSVACRSDEGYIEGILHENGRVFGVQSNPERIGFAKRRKEAVDGALLFDVFRGMMEK